MKTNKATKVGVGPKHQKEVPVFESTNQEEIDRILNEKRQNKIQAIKDYFLSNMVLREQALYHKQIEDRIANKQPLLDAEYGFEIGEDLAKAIATRMYVQLKFDRTRIKHMQEDLFKTWGLNQEEVDKMAHAWFVEGKSIE